MKIAPFQIAATLDVGMVVWVPGRPVGHVEMIDPSGILLIRCTSGTGFFVPAETPGLVIVEAV